MKPVRRRSGQLTAWIAIFAILLAALAPSLARALASPSPAIPWNEICTAAGTRPAATDVAAGSEPERHEGSGYAHCPYCVNPTGPFVLPVADRNFLAVGARGIEPSPRVCAAPPLCFIQPAARPRAPPAVS